MLTVTYCHQYYLYPYLERNVKEIEFDIKGRIISGSLWSLSSKIAVAILWMLQSSLVTYNVSPPVAGCFFLLSTFVTIFSVAGSFGLPQTLTKVLSSQMSFPDKLAIAKNAQFLTIFFSFFAFLLCALSISNVIGFFFSSISISGLAIPCALWVALRIWNSLFTEMLLGRHDQKGASLLGNVCPLLCSTLIIGIGSYFSVVNDIKDYAWCMLLGFLFTLPLHIQRLLRHQLIGIEHDQKIQENLLHESWPLMGHYCFYTLLNTCDLWMVTYLRPPADVALYGAVQRVMQAISFPLVVLTAFVPPIISSLYTQNKIRTLSTILQGLALCAMIPAALILVIFTTFGKTLLGSLFGEFYSQGASILWILVVGRVVLAATGVNDSSLIMTGGQRILFRSTVMSLFLGIGIGFLLGSFHGKEGVAIASASMFVFQNLFLCFSLYRTTGIKTWVTFKPLTIRAFLKFFSNNSEVIKLS